MEHYCGERGGEEGGKERGGMEVGMKKEKGRKRGEREEERKGERQGRERGGGWETQKKVKQKKVTVKDSCLVSLVVCWCFIVVSIWWA